MSKWGLKYKTFEVLWPDEWNVLIDALDDLAKATGCILGFCKEVQVNAGQAVNVCPFTGESGLSHGLILPIGIIGRAMAVHVTSNSLDAKALIYLRKNQVNTDFYVEVPSGQTGVFYDEVEGVVIDAQNSVDFYIDALSASSGSIVIISLSLYASYKFGT